ncbi:hypothetical protein BWP39_16295 [Paraburkholderia acidicola]|uniref:DUF4123 domain-containing protein n=2 Tax=Paraburkholderia acidicola TaxID=1912599 RepID=A0A2A4F0I4_9BURK|nr:hypothetical protein BWP39_16295 [Paraburkholderia acidicola]
MQAAADPDGPFTHGYALIEPTTIGFAPYLRTLTLHSCTPLILAHRDELMPKLIDVASLEPDQQVALTELWREEPDPDRPPVVCAWIDSDWPLAELVRHIAHYLIGPGADGRPVLWRYYDPRVLSLALVVLKPSQRNALLQPMRTWQFAWGGHKWQIAGPALPVPEAGDPASGWPTPEQWVRIDRSEIVTKVLHRLPVLSPEEVRNLPGLLDRILADVAVRGGLSNLDDLTDYSLCCLHYGQAFADHPKLQEVWPALARHEVSWAEAKTCLTDADYRGLAERASHPIAERI